MVAEIVLSSVIGFLFLIAASYIGTTMALRGFFGREYRADEPSFSLSDDADSRESDSKEP